MDRDTTSTDSFVASMIGRIDFTNPETLTSSIDEMMRSVSETFENPVYKDHSNPEHVAYMERLGSGDSGLRNHATYLARHDHSKATEYAERIKSPWFRTQAIAAIARHAPTDEECLALANRAFAVAREGADGYQIAGVSAWPLRALIERGFVNEAMERLPELIEYARQETRLGSRAEALMRLFEAALPLGAHAQELIVEALLEIEHTSPGWRSSRALRDCCQLILHTDSERAKVFSAKIHKTSYRQQALTAIAEGRCGYRRTYFD